MSNNGSETGSVISEKDLILSFNDILFSTSPCVFQDIHKYIDTIEQFEQFEKEKNQIKNNFEIVLKDINIIGLKFKIDQNYIQNIKNKYNIVLKEIIIFGLKREVKKYKFGYTVYMSLINGDPFFKL
jgi:hypothetical protein